MSEHINSETGESIQQGRSPRFTMWVALLIFSTITMGSAVEVKNSLDEPDSAAKWAVACSVISFALSVIVTVGHFLPVLSTMLVDTMLEGILTIVLAAFWAATVAIVTNASNGLGVQEDSSNQVLNGNLYYGSWAGFVTSVILLVNYLRSAFGVDVVGEVRNRSARLSLWAGLLAAALIVMGSSARILNSDCPDVESVKYCKRSKLAVATGVLTVFLSLAVVGMKFLTTSAPFIVEFAAAILLAIMNAFGVAFITSADGPGSAIGNLYYSSWISFVLSAFLAADCFNQFSGGDAGGTQHKNEEHQNGDIEVETFDDHI